MIQFSRRFNSVQVKSIRIFNSPRRFNRIRRFNIQFGDASRHPASPPRCDGAEHASDPATLCGPQQTTYKYCYMKLKFKMVIIIYIYIIIIIIYIL